MKRNLYAAVIAVLATAAGASGTAAAGDSRENDALAISQASIDLTQAIAAAEQHVGGKASKAEVERHKGQLLFEVEVVKDSTVMDVKVDAKTGKVISAKEDQADDDEDENDKDDSPK